MANAAGSGGKSAARLKRRNETKMIMRQPIMLVAILAVIVLVAFPIFRRIFKKYDALNSSVQENVAAIRVVKSFVTEDYETTKFRKASQDVRKDFTNAEKLIALNSPVMMFFIFAAIIAVDYVGASIIVSSPR